MNTNKICLLIVLCANFSFLSAQSIQADETHSIYFSPSSAFLQEETQLNLYKLKKDLAQESRPFYIEIHAHTDNVGTVEENRLLSEHRAAAVANYLIEQGFEKDKIKDFTYGEELPKASNSTDFGKQENRRVDILVFYKQSNNTSQNFTKMTRTALESTPKEIIEQRKGVLDLAEKALEADVQLYDIDPKSDTLLVCRYGTAIYIPANTFLPSKNKDQITIAINEVYKKSDMVLFNFSTSSDGRLLESGGMVNITALDGGKEYNQPLQHDLSFFFPTADMRGDMDLFFGESDAIGDLNWSLAKRGIQDYEGYLSEVEKEESEDGNYFDNLGIKKRRRVVNPKSNIVCINQAMVNMMGVNPSPMCVAFERCPLFWCQMEKTFAPKVYNQKKAAQYQACLSQFLEENKLTNDMAEGDLLELTDELKRRYGNSPQKIREALEKRKQEIFERAFDEGKASMEAMNFYVFSSRKMGAINCDAFPNIENPETVVYDSPKDVKVIDAKLVFKSRNSVLNASFGNGKIAFTNVPRGEKVAFVAIDYSDMGKPRLSIQEFEIGKTKPSKIEFVEYASAEELRNALKSLDS